MNSNNIQETIVNEIGILLSPLLEAAENKERARILFKVLGWDFDKITKFPINELLDIFKDIFGNYNTLKDQVLSLSNESKIDDIIKIIESVRDLFNAINNINSLIKNLSGGSFTIDFKNEFIKLGDDLINYLVGFYLNLYYPVFFNSLVLFGLADVKTGLSQALLQSNGEVIRFPYNEYDIKFNKIGDFLKDPVNFLKDEYLPNGNLYTEQDAKFTSDKLFPRLSALASSLAFPSYFGVEDEDASLFDSDNYDLVSQMLTIHLDKGDPTANYGFSLSLSSSDEEDLGLVIIPFGELNLSETFGSWFTELNVSSSIDAFALSPNGLVLSGANGEISINLALLKLLDPGQKYAIKLGSDSGTNLQIPTITFIGNLSAESAGNPNYSLEFDLGRSSLVLTPGDGDGFLSKILPKEGTVIPFDLGIGYSSSSKGLYFKGGGAGLEVKIPVKKTDEKKPGIRINSVSLSIKPNEDGSIPVRAAASFTVQLGAVTAIVDEVGLYADFSFPESGGNLGPVDLAFGFKPPTGIGINIEGSTISGGGFLSIDAEAGKYQGALDLKFSEISISAIGLLQTKLPSGNDGYSLLVLMAASFTPAIQLGFGFTLDKIGGIAGLHRMMNAEAIRDGVREGKMGEVMFSDSPSKNAAEILSVLDSYFPVAENKFVFGPMLRINWGTPSLISLEAALLIQTDPWEFAIAGVLSSTLPSKENPLICLNVAFIGVVSPSKQSLKIDASLYKSKILTYQLHGDMSVRFFWGERGGFLLSAGGFHPSYQAPPEMEVRQDMRRMSLSLYSSDKVKIGAEAYFAVTSNTVQFGTQIYLIAKCGEVSAKAHLGFDALLFYKPKLQFTVDISAGASLYTFGENIGSVSLKFKLSGPGRWKAVGTATLDVWLLPDVNVDFEEAWGEDVETPSPSIDVYEKVKEALAKDGNWQLEQSGDDGFVRLRQIKEEERILTPGAKIRIKQLVAPLEVTIDKFGNGKIEGKRKFKIINPKIQYKDETTWSDASFDPNVKDQFAPAEYFNLSTDSQSLLTRPGFEYHTSGLVIKGLPETDQISIGSMRRKNMTMQQILIDKNTSGEIIINEPTSITESLSVFEGSLWNNAASQAPLSANVVDTPVYSPVTSYAIAQEQYVVVKSEDMSRHEPAVAYETRSEAQQKIRELLTDKQVKEGELLAVPLHELN